MPIGVLGHDMRVLGRNRLCRAVFAAHVPFDAPWSAPDTVNWARLLFTDPARRTLFVDWDEVTVDLAGRMRNSLARTPTDAGLRALVDELRDTSDRFATPWDWHAVRERSLGVVQLSHPTVGMLELHDMVLGPADCDRQLLIVFQADPGSVSEQRLAQLAG